MNIIENLLTVNTYSRPGKKRLKTTKIAVHYVGNPGSTALNNRNYFENLQSGKSGTYASSHYIIGLEGEIIRCVPESEIAYTTNSANAYSIGIECCHPKSDGVFNEKTRKALIELCADLCQRYDLDPELDIIRHYDITKKACPFAWAADKGPKYDDFIKFKKEVKTAMTQIIKLKINLFGTEKLVEAIDINGNNYCKIRDLQTKDKFEVGYANGKVTINNKPFDTKDSIMLNNTNYVKLQSLTNVVKVSYDSIKKMPVIQ